MTSPADRTPLYQQIAEAIRQEILYGKLQAGEALPTVRDLAGQWQCTLGTVQKAYRELVHQGLVVSQPGRGTKVTATLAAPSALLTPLRQAGLVNQAEAFLLQAAGVKLVSHTVQVGHIIVPEDAPIPPADATGELDADPIRCFDPKSSAAMAAGTR